MFDREKNDSSVDDKSALSTPKSSSRRNFFIKSCISTILLVLIYYRIDFNEFIEDLRKISFNTALSLIALYLIGQFISAIKWRVFIHGVGIERPLKQVVGSYFLGMYVNSFGLGTVGGDVARAVAIRPEEGKRAGALATVIADRVHGLIVLSIIGVVAIIFVRPPIITPTFFYLGLMGLFFAVVGWLVGPRILTKFFSDGHRYAESALRVANAFPRNRKALTRITLLSLMLHCIQIFMHVLIAWGLGADSLTIGLMFALVPIVNIASAMPISINGLGVREALYQLLFIPFGVSSTTAVAFGLIWFSVITSVSIFGGIILAPLATGEKNNI